MTFSGKNFNFQLGKKTYIMGILNVTADSFFDGGKYNSPKKAVEHSKRMLSEGADIIDIGAHSTRPGHTVLSSQEELEIIKHYLPLLAKETNTVISVDTFYPVVAQYALDNGASIINDVSGLFNPQMAELVKEYNCGWIIMHTGGGDASTVMKYKNSVTQDVVDFFNLMLQKCESYGINKNQIAFDIGIGFGKSYRDNLELIKNIKDIKIKDVALLTALSSKRVVATATEALKEDLVYGTISANSLAIQGGTDIIRVHNVRENVLAAKMCDAVVRCKKMDKIIVKNLKLFCYHGVNPEEKIDGQNFVFDIEATVDLSLPCKTDNVDDTVSYAKIIKTVRRVAQSEKNDLLERVAQRVADELFEEFDKINSLIITLKKPEAPIKADFEYVAVTIERSRE